MYSIVLYGDPSSRKEGDSEALTGTTCTGLVRTQYVLVPSVLLVYLPLHIASGRSPSGVQRFRYLVSSPFNIEHVTQCSVFSYFTTHFK